MGSDKPDIVIVGGGIAGASAAYELAAFGKVTLLEREPQLGYHSTGRSAASFTENYGTTIIRRLAIASRGFLESPPKDFAEQSLLSPRGMLTIAREDQLQVLAKSLEQARALVPSIHRITLEEAFERVPILRPDYVAGAFLEPDSRDIDVNSLHVGFIKGARHRGVAIVTQAEVMGVEHSSGRWTLTTSQGEFGADILVNAAGAWCDVLAEMAGIKPLGLIPKRRTAFLVPLPAGLRAGSWPMVDDVAEDLYFKPDAGQLLVSPADATPTDPVDAYPDDFDVAQGVERLERATTLEVQRVSRSWAGLRSFVPDGGPVVGFESSATRRFFWLAAQGGYGIKTSPALSRACLSLIRDDRLPEDLVALGIDALQLSPLRLRRPLKAQASGTTLF